MALTASFRKRLGRFDLNVSLQAENEILALLGPSGCGKSMTLKCIAGIETPDEGVIRLNGRTLFDSAAKIDLPPQQRRVGYLFQQYALFPHMTVEQNIAAGIRDKSRRRESCLRWLSALGLEGLEHRYPRQLSGGQQQRAALARMLANEPELLLFDEPFSALDSHLKWRLELELADTLSAYGGTAVYVSHDKDEVYRLCDTVCVLSEGRSEEKYLVDQLFRTPRTRAACLLSGCRNLSAAKPVKEHTLFASDWGRELTLSAPAAEDTAWVGIHARHLRPACGQTANLLTCQVLRTVEDAFSTVILLRPLGAQAVLHMEMSKEDWPAYEGQDQLNICLPPEHLMPLR